MPAGERTTPYPYLGHVARVPAAGQLYVRLPRLHPTFDYGPCIYLGSRTLAAGDAVIVQFLEGDLSRPAIISPQ